MLPKLTKDDLEQMLRRYERNINHYRAEQKLRPSEYNLQMLKKIDLMVVALLARFHNQ